MNEYLYALAVFTLVVISAVLFGDSLLSAWKWVKQQWRKNQ